MTDATPTELEELERIRNHGIEWCGDDLYHAFPALAKALREAWVEGETLARDRHIEQMRADRAERLMAETVERLMRAEELNDCLHKERDAAIRLGDKRLEILWDEKQAEIAKIAAERDNAQAEIKMLRGVGCGEWQRGGDGPLQDGPCKARLKCARRERDEARDEVERLKGSLITANALLAEALKKLGASGFRSIEDCSTIGDLVTRMKAHLGVK